MEKTVDCNVSDGKNNVDDVKKTYRYQCKKCGEKYKNSYLLQMHNLTVHENETPKCQFCGKIVISLAAHIKNVHGGKVKCDLCDILFDTKKRFQTHFKNVHCESKERFPCPLCNKTYKDKKGIIYHHKFVHSKERNSICHICQKGFIGDNFLNRHIRHVHEKVKPIECRLCKKKFPQKQNLEKHFENVHEKLKPFTCEICGNVFAQASSLLLHQRNIHKMEKKKL